MTQPIVSIVLPVYNAGTTLPLALESIYRQTFRDWELILMDDGSTDDCMSGFRASDSRVKVVQDGQNLGLAARLNQGIDLARGRYLARMDQDDVAYPERLAAQRDFLERHANVDVAATRAMVFRSDGSAIGLFPFRGSHEEICAAPWRGFYFPHPTWMGRIEWFRRHRYRLPEIVRGEDQDLLLRSYDSSRFACLPEVLMGYRQTELPLVKILTSRRNLARVQWSVNLGKGRPGHALLGALTCFLKGVADTALASIGAQRNFVTRQTRLVPPKEIDRWKTIWEELQQPSAIHGGKSEQNGRDPARAAVKSVCLVTTSPLIVNFFLVPLLSGLKRAFRVSLALNLGEDTPLTEDLGVGTIHVPIQRKLSPWGDLGALVRLVRLFRKERFDAVHSFSPKAGFLAMIAGRITGVPVRIHTYTGQVWMTRSFIMRTLLIAADRAIARNATHLLADSPSQLRVLVENRIVGGESACRVLGSGSVCGVDPARFRPDAPARAAVRRELGIGPDVMVFLFLGRMTRDKGVLDLARAFASVAEVHPAAALLLVGPDEERVRPSVESICGAHSRKLRFVDYTRVPERYVAASDVLCLPSYREGFGAVIIEAAAAGIPATGSRIYGITDAIIDGETGLLHAPGNANDLAEKMGLLLTDPALRERLGTRARQRAVNEFSQQRLTRALLEYYQDALG